MQSSQYTVQFPTKPWKWDAPISYNLNPKVKNASTESNGSTVVTNGVNGHQHNHYHSLNNNDDTSLSKDEQDPPTFAQLESELPFTDHDQIPLGEVLSRVVQDVYAELVTLADTLPSSSDAARKRMLADFVVKHKKQVVKLYAIVKWAKDARDIQLCMNIITFLLGTNIQLQEVTNALELTKVSLAPAKLRNHDLLTSLDVLTTGTYQRLPTGIKRTFIPKPNLTKEEIFQTLADYDHIIRYRLKASEIIPVEMRRYHVSRAQVHFYVPNLFRVSLSLRGSAPNDAWFLADVEFDMKIGGDDTGVVEFPRTPTGVTKQFIVDEADTRLGLYSFPEETSQQDPQTQTQIQSEAAAKEKEPEKDGKEKGQDQQSTAPPPSAPVPPSVTKLPPHVIDAPLVRLYNFLQMLSLSYQLEILHYQAQRMRSLGWSDFLKVSLAKDRKSMSVSYWIRAAPPPRPPNAPQPRTKIPLLGGTIVIGVQEMSSISGSDKNKSKTTASGGLTAASSSTTLGGSTTRLQPQASSSSAATAGTSATSSASVTSPPITVHGASIQHAPGRSHIERVLHELSVVGKMKRRVRSSKDVDAVGTGHTAAAVGPGNKSGGAATATPHALKDSAPTPRPRKNSASTPRPRKDSASTPHSRKNSISTPRPTAGSALSGLIQTQTSSTSVLTSSSTIPTTQPPQPSPQLLPQMSDDVERLYISVQWTPENSALGFMTNPAEWICRIDVDASDLDFQALLMKILRKHSEAILKAFRKQLVEGPHRNVFGEEEVLMGFEPDSTPTLSIHLCASEQVVVTIDPRTGKFSLRDTGDLTSAGRGPRFAFYSDRINENPVMMLSTIVTLRYSTIVENAEQKTIALGLQTFRNRSLSREEMSKFGSAARASLFVQLHHFRSHYLVLVVAEEEFKYALVSVKSIMDAGNFGMVLSDIGWLDVKRVRGSIRVRIAPQDDEDVDSPDITTGMKRKAAEESGRGGPKEKSFNLDSSVIKELYAYCCARVAHTRIEQQLKARGIAYKHVSPLSSTNDVSHGMGGIVAHPTNNGLGVQNAIKPDPTRAIHSSLASCVPTLCVQSKDILSGVPAAEAAMRNVRFIPINWWSTEKKCQVVTCVQLKYVQPPVGVDKASAATIIRPSKSVIYDTREAIISFLSDDVDTCVDEFLDGWARVSTIVVIAREVSQMAKANMWDDVQLLSFDLQTVEFTYITGYALSISCTHQQQAAQGSYRLQFSRVLSSSNAIPDGATSRGRAPGVTLHDEAAPFLRPLLSNGRLAQSLKEIVEILRDTLPVALELEKLTRGKKREDDDMDLDDAPAPKDMDEIPEEFRDLNVDVYPKAFAWYRVLFGDLRHALDFRLLAKKRIAIVDASQSLFDASPPSTTPLKNPQSMPPPPPPPPRTDATTSIDPRSIGVLEPIPDFKNILAQVAVDVREETWSASLTPRGIAYIDNGIVCSTNVAGKVGLALFKKVLDKLDGRNVASEGSERRTS